MAQKTDKQIDNLNDLVKRLQDAGLNADDLFNEVKDEKYNEATLLMEEGLLAVCEYLQENGWALSAIERAALAEKH